MKPITPEIRQKLIEYQKNEITEFYIYLSLAKKSKTSHNAEVLEKIAQEEMKHYQILKKYSETEVQPSKFKVWLYSLLASLLGLTFTIKLMEQSEESAQERYEKLKLYVRESEEIIKDEFEHERELINLLDEEMLEYMGSVVLGLNDALVELTGALAGFTLALQNTKLIAILGGITGFAAALSMAASEYLSTKTENTNKKPLKASVYTGLAYIFTVFTLIFPYVFITNYFIALGVALFLAVLIIAFFNYYIAIAQDKNFGKQFAEMLIISLAVSAISFIIGLGVRYFFGIDV